MATNTMENTLVAAFTTDGKAQAAVQDLERAGVRREQIHVHADRTSGTKESTQHEGGFSGWMKSLFGENETRYTTAYEGGNTIVAVDTTSDKIDSIADILDRHNPADLHAESAAASAAGVGSTGQRTATSPSGGTNKGTQERSSAVPVVQEDIAVGKRSYQRGGVRVYSHTVDTPVEEKVRLRDERVYVDRQPVDRPVTDADLSGKQEKVIEVKEFAEEPVVEKRARVVEEVRVGKNVSERTETVRDSVRHTEVEVEPIEGAPEGAIDDTEFRRHFQQTYGASGAAYDDYGPAYAFGYTNARDPKYRNRPFSDVEPDLRAGYERKYPNSTWDKMKDSVRYGWNRVTGKA